MTYHLKLVKGLSYHGVIFATVKNPDVYTDDKAIADKAVSSGYFVLENDVNDDSIFDTKELTAADENIEDISCLTIRELKTYAKEHNIDVSHCENRADYVNAIKEVKKYEV